MLTSSLGLVRVDKAPALVSLARRESSDLSKLGIKLDLPLDDNKNSNCCLDRAMCEFEDEMRNLSPSGGKVSSLVSQASTLLNHKIRDRGFSASEIHFSRDSDDNQNLVLDDLKLQAKKISRRLYNHPSAARSRAPKGILNSPPDVENGDIIFVKTHGSKHQLREPHIVISSSDQTAVIRKAMHSNSHDDKPLSFAPQI